MEPLELRGKMGIRVSEEAQASVIQARLEVQALAELAAQALAIQAGVAIQALGRLAPQAVALARP